MSRQVAAGSTATGSRLFLHALSHGSVLSSLLYSLFWLSGQAAPAASASTNYLVAGWGVLVGLALSHIIHEWGHYLGARITGAALSLKQWPSPLFFDFDLETNSRRQFLLMSAGGLLGNLLLLSILLIWARSATLVLTSALAATAGQLLFVLILELPVSLAVLRGAAPRAALAGHFAQGGPLFLRAFLAGVTVATAVFVSH